MKVAILEIQDNLKYANPIMLGIGKGFKKLGHEAFLLNLAKSPPANEEESKKKLFDELTELKPAAIIWHAAEAWKYIDVINRFGSRKLNFWFDDPILRIEWTGIEDKVMENRWNVQHFVWDGYWREKMFQKFMVQSKPIHLAAGEEDFYPSNFINNKEEASFIGMLHSPREIWKTIDGLPDALKDVATHIYNSQIRYRAGRLPSWDVMIETWRSESTPGDNRMFDIECSRNRIVLARFRSAIWGLAKNECRIKMLLQALSVTPVRMFSETNSLYHANESEVRGLLGSWGNNFKFTDTSGIGFAQIGELYHYGWIQLQAIDPQSVRGGIPMRAFQCAASGRPLITDVTPEMQECFEFGKEMIGIDPNFYAKVLSDLKEKKVDLEGIGQSALERFKKEHTWKHRIEKIINDERCFSPAPKI